MTVSIRGQYIDMHDGDLRNVGAINAETYEGYGKATSFKFVVRAGGGTYYAYDGLNNTLAFGGANDHGGVSGTNASEVVQACFDNLSPSRSWREDVKLIGNFAFTKTAGSSTVKPYEYCIKMEKLTGLDLYDARMFLANGQTCNLLVVDLTGSSQQSEGSYVFGGIFQGNKTQNGSGDDVQSSGIYVWNGSHSYFKDIVLLSFARHGMIFDGVGLPTEWSGLETILNCRAYYNDHSGFVTNVHSDNSFINCVAQSNSINGFYFLYPQQCYRLHSIYNGSGFNIQGHCHMVECYADTNERYGFYANTLAGAIYQLWFNNCYAYRNGQETHNTYNGFHIQGVDKVELVNCRSKPTETGSDPNQQRYGFYFNDCQNIQMTGCHSYKNASVGVLVENCGEFNANGVQSVENQSHGFRIENSSLTCLTGCVGSRNLHNGVSVYNAPSTNIQGGEYNQNSTASTDYHGISFNGESDYCMANGVTARDNGGCQIAILSGLCNKNMITNCVTDSTSAGTCNIADVSSDAIIRNNVGFVTEAYGAATISAGQTKITITHGLGGLGNALTPASGNIQITFRNDAGDFGNWWVGNVSSSTFDLFIKTALISDLQIGWSVKSLNS